MDSESTKMRERECVPWFENPLGLYREVPVL
jgi:hypothetical protein